MGRNRIIRAPQQSDLWIAARRGRVTGSRLGDVMAAPTTRASTRNGVKCEAGSEALEREKYRRELVVERITGVCVNHFTTRAMEDGIEREKYARMLYEAETQQVVELVGFALHPKWDFFGASVDGLCGEEGGVEFKCPTNLVHDSYCQDIEVLVEQYKWQCIAGFICFPERQWWDLVSFGPHFPDPWKLVKHRFHREAISETLKIAEEEIWKFNEEVEQEIARRRLPPTVFDIMPGDTPQSKPSDLPSEALLTEEDLPQWWRDKLAVDERE